ncbi:MAG: helix-turn-helix domain-containing protein [Lachnospiraceae bacterium]|nr:helix-turn-helix domain-containing protein [Lachnospiraceae bacterium]
MSEINAYVGGKIRMYRKEQGMTLQQLADRIHKSRASISKYENGEIALDIETLFEIADALRVVPGQLMDYHPDVPKEPSPASFSDTKSPFFQAKRLYFYFYDGRYKRLKDGIIDIRENESKPGNYEASLSISAVTPTGRSSEIYYTGKVVYSDMLIRFSFVNQCNALEEDLLYIFNPLEIRDMTDGLLCGISSADLMPCAFKCLVSLTPQEHTEAFKKQLLITKRELQRWQKLNMLIVDNRG